MKAYTLKERLTAGLLALGWQACPTGSGKYTCFTHSERGPEHKRFVGSSGALRSGRSASNSISLNFGDDRIYKAVLEAGDKALAKPTLSEFKA